MNKDYYYYPMMIKKLKMLIKWFIPTLLYKKIEKIGKWNESKESWMRGQLDIFMKLSGPGVFRKVETK